MILGPRPSRNPMARRPRREPPWGLVTNLGVERIELSGFLKSGNNRYSVTPAVKCLIKVLEMLSSRNQMVPGVEGRVSELSGRLTAVAAYRQTICDVKELDYLIRKINDEDVPEVAAVRQARDTLLQTVENLLTLLTWHDFELLVELVFAESGWRRVGQTGGTQKTVDMELMLPSTGETAFVQVKSRTNQAELDGYIEAFQRRDEDRMFFVYHSVAGTVFGNDPRVTMIGPQRLSEMILEAGLVDWLLKKAG